MATLVGGVAQAAPRVGTTPAEIQANFVSTVDAHLAALYASGGTAALNTFFNSLSDFQLYEFNELRRLSGGPALVTVLNGILHTNCSLSTPMAACPVVGPVLSRLVNVYQAYRYTGPTIPGGRKPVVKIGTIAGFPANATLYEVYLEYATYPGYTAAEAIGAAVWDFSGPIAKAFGAGYLIGTGISWFIQSFAPSFQEAIGDFIGPLVDNTFTLSIDPTVIEQVNTIDVMGSPGENLVDYNSYQQSDNSLRTMLLTHPQ